MQDVHMKLIKAGAALSEQILKFRVDIIHQGKVPRELNIYAVCSVYWQQRGYRQTWPI